MVELLSVQNVILYDGQERTRSAPAQAQLPAQFQVQQLQAEAQTEPESLAVNPAEAGEGTGKRPYDEYSEEPPKTPIGLYRLVSDEEGEPAVEFDDPEGNPAEEPAEDTRKTTTSTEDVDREIEELQALRKRLNLKIAAASPEQAEQLRQQLAHLEQELLWKDNDTYRKRHAKVVEE